MENTPQFTFKNQSDYYKGKVRDVYFFGDKIAVVASDRISAFDHILPRTIPYKGQVLNLIAAHFLAASMEIVPNWLLSVPHPSISIGHKCEPIRIEMVVRGYLAGHAWRTYQSGERFLCGVEMPDGLKESDRFPLPIITPATKAEKGHDEDISAEEILKRKIVTPQQWGKLCEYAMELFKLGTQMAEQRGLILVDTKYEFGLKNDEIYLIDEIHTPDSSRYYVLEGYLARQKNDIKQKQLSKEFVREWLMRNGFQGEEGQVMPEMSDNFVQYVSERYIELYELLVGNEFTPKDSTEAEMEEIIKNEIDAVL